MACSTRWRGGCAAELMAGERDFIARMLRPIAGSGAARGLADDAAVWTPALGRDLVFTHDVLAAGVHYLPDDPPGDVAWKLLAVNLSDLAAMGAAPAGVLMGLALSEREDEAWRAAFVAGLGRALDHFGVQLWGGDTVGGVRRGGAGADGGGPGRAGDGAGPGRGAAGRCALGVGDDRGCRAGAGDRQRRGGRSTRRFWRGSGGRSRDWRWAGPWAAWRRRRWMCPTGC